MRRIFAVLILVFLLVSCGKGKAVFICDYVYAETTVTPCRIDRSLRRAVRGAGYGYDYIEIPVNSVLSDALPEKAAVIILSPFLAKQAEACAAERPETVFVTLEQRLPTRLPNLKGLPRKGESGYAGLGTLFGRLSRERIPDPFPRPEKNEESSESNALSPSETRTSDRSPVSDSSNDESGFDNGNAEKTDDEDFPDEWQPEEAVAGPTVRLKPGIVFANLSTEKEKNYLAFVNAFSTVNPHASADLVSLDVPPSRDTASLGRLSEELISRHCNLIFLDAGSATPQLIETLSTESVLLAVFPAPPDSNVSPTNIDLVLEWDYDSAFGRFFADADAGTDEEIFLELKIKKYKKDSILYPYYAEKIIDR